MSKHSAYFENHLTDHLQDKCKLNDVEMEKLIKFLISFADGDICKMIKSISKGKNKIHLDEIVSKIRDGSGQNSISSTPISIPLTKDMVISSLYIGDKMKRFANPAFSLPVSDDEKQHAENMRKDFELLVEAMREFSEFIAVFFDNSSALESGKGIDKLSAILKKFELGVKSKFNAFIKILSTCLEHFNGKFPDTKIDNIRDLIVENAKGMRNGLMDLLRAFKKTEDKDFLKNVRELYLGVKKFADQLGNVVRNELFAHIDYDIIGKIRLGSLMALPLTIGQVKNRSTLINRGK